MTQEEKSKAYNELVDKIKKAYLYAQTNSMKAVLEDILPELKESEDERIRKALIQGFNECLDSSSYPKNALKYWHGIVIEDILAWLEKQESVGEIVERCKTSWYNEGKIQGQIEGLSDEEKYQQGWHDALEKQGQESRKVSIWKHWKDGIAGNGNGEPIFLIKTGNTYTLSSVLGYECDYIELSELNNLMLEKQGEQKPILDFKDADWYVSKVDGKIHNIYYTVDKVKPKFKVGDWCIDNEDGTIFQIVKVLDNTYTYKTNKGKEYSCTHYSLENDAKLWTIQDAKDGDVLAYGQVVFIFKKIHCVCLRCYCSSHNDGSFIAYSYDLLTDKYFGGVYPATKEQHDLLFQKMKEEGYAWNEETLELKKIDIVR